MATTSRVFPPGLDIAPSAAGRYPRARFRLGVVASILLACALAACDDADRVIEPPADDEAVDVPACDQVDDEQPDDEDEDDE